MSDKNLESFVVIDRLTVGPVDLQPRKVSAPYIVERSDGKTEENVFVYSFEEEVFDPDNMSDQNLASMMISQIALNYGLFCREINFRGIFDNTDKAFLKSMMENTSREIYINKLLIANPFVIDDYKGLKPERKSRYTAAKILFTAIPGSGVKLYWEHWEMDRRIHSVLSSGGKDSLLSYALLEETGKETHPLFVNESGRHWFTAINAYRYFKSNIKNTGRVWSNSDRIFTWMLGKLPFIRPDHKRFKSDDYPVRLWTVGVFLFGVIPLAKKRKSGRIVIGDEYDSTQKTIYKGITHYSGLYDQSRYFDNALSRYYMKKGWNISQFSVLRCLSEMLILKILVKRYPRLQQHQVSCHSSHEKGGRMYPCGNCEKCRRIAGMLRVLGEDPKNCGYSERQINDLMKSFAEKNVKQISSDASHLFYLLLEKKLIPENEYTRNMAKPYPQIMKLRFDNERSVTRDIPNDLRIPLIRIFLEYANGAVRYSNRHWEDFDVLSSEEIQSDYPFEISFSNIDTEEKQKEYLWAELTWPEINERLTKVDTAILPCGSIEQHGRHLPVDIDYFDAEYLARRVAAACSRPRPFVLPAVPYGVSYHHEDFKGTLSVTNNSLAPFVYDIGMSLAKNGIRKLVIINGHGDNAPTLNYAAQMINRDAGIFVCVDTGESSDEDIYRLIETPNDIHAGEIETSTALAIRPHLVKMNEAADRTIEFENPYLDFSSGRGVPWYVRTKVLSESGVLGNPTKATAAKGEKIWDIMIAHLVRFVEEIKNADPETLHQRKY